MTSSHADGERPGRRIDIPSVPNLRDVGGDATSHGRRVRMVQLYRSTELSHLGGIDLPAFTRLGIRTVFDPPPLLQPVLGVDPDYLNCSMDEMHQRFGPVLSASPGSTGPHLVVVPPGQPQRPVEWTPERCVSRQGTWTPGSVVTSRMRRRARKRRDVLGARRSAPSSAERVTRLCGLRDRTAVTGTSDGQDHGDDQSC